ncbi:hypothetical protein BDZ91DRAFT_814892 [Kalaharituber pfeilii]|nr:hypothetical protein BDZ91DRAFT_814892 [Kalaharituber pfeilii]
MKQLWLIVVSLAVLLMLLGKAPLPFTALSANCNMHGIIAGAPLAQFSREQSLELQQMIETCITVQIANLKSYVDTETTKLHNRVDQVEARLDQVVARLDRVEAHLDQIEARLEKVGRILDDLLSRMDGLTEMLNKKTGELPDNRTDMKMDLDTSMGNAKVTFTDRLLDKAFQLVWFLFGVTCIHLFFTSEEWIARRDRRWRAHDAKKAAMVVQTLWNKDRET